MTGILFIARLGSTRLPNKHLIEVEGKTFMEWLVERYSYDFKEEINNGSVKLIVATSYNKENKKFEDVLKNLPVTIFYGNEENIPLRQLECAEEYKLQSIISIDGDDILCSSEAAKQIFIELKNNKNDLVKSSGLPFGMNCMGYSTVFLKKAIESTDQQKYETGWGRIFENQSVHDIKLGDHSENMDMRLTLDYQLDADFFKKVFSYYGKNIVSVSDEELIETVTEKKIFEINKSLNEEYWNNFNKEKNAEANSSNDTK